MVSKFQKLHIGNSVGSVRPTRVMHHSVGTAILGDRIVGIGIIKDCNIFSTCTTIDGIITAVALYLVITSTAIDDVITAVTGNCIIGNATIGIFNNRIMRNAQIIFTGIKGCAGIG